MGFTVALMLSSTVGLSASCQSEVEPIEPATTTSPATESADGADSGSGSEGPCVGGQEGCPCTPGGSCDPGLMCLSEICVDLGDDCPVGSDGCPCTEGGGCDPGLMCTDMVCAPA